MIGFRSPLPDIDIRGLVAAWVLGAHAYAVLVPLVLVFAVYQHSSYLAETSDWPVLFYAAAALLCAGSAFEVSQNAIDRWYITPDTGSAGRPAFCDFLFSFCITAGQALIALAIAGRSVWVAGAAALAVALQPLCYAAQVAVFAPLAVTGLLASVLAYRAFGDPGVFLQLLLVALTMYFFTGLLRSAAQSLHGWTTACASSGIWFLAAAIGNGADGTPAGWATVALVAAAAVLLAAVAWPRLAALESTPRIGS